MRFSFQKNNNMDLKILDIKKDKEYVLFRAEKDQNLWPYILFDATFDETGLSSNINRHSFIFPNLNVKRGDFIVLYTCKGKYETFEMPEKCQRDRSVASA